MDTSFHFMKYYNKNFIDPLYLPYINRQNNYNQMHLSFNPYMDNTNELFINKGLLYKKQYSHQPCQIGYESTGLDFCRPEQPKVSNFYECDVHPKDVLRPGVQFYGYKKYTPNYL